MAERFTRAEVDRLEATTGKRYERLRATVAAAEVSDVLAELLRASIGEDGCEYLRGLLSAELERRERTRGTPPAPR